MAYKLKPYMEMEKPELREGKLKLLEKAYAEQQEELNKMKDNDAHGNRVSIQEGRVHGIELAAIYLGYEFVEVTDNVKSS
ncbi:hypothetical protein [Terribacillus sp. JSM ZJ617]|uniref:hypothetical protein n=1 Tax=Terribacillus sp. JSM ZJ617 TaxID=3342119 RepID=UPI0035A831A4